MAAAADERHRNPIADSPPRHTFADACDGAGELMTGHVRQHDVRIVPHPAMPVAPAKARGLDLDHQALGTGRRIGHGPDRGLLAELFVDDGFHGAGLPLETCGCRAAYRGDSRTTTGRKPLR